MNTELGVQSTNYGDNTNEIKTDYEDENETDYGDFEDVDLQIIRNNTLLSPPRSAKNPVLENRISMVEFDIIQSSPPADPAAIINQGFLSNGANWKRKSIKDIFAKISEVNRIQ